MSNRNTHLAYGIIAFLVVAIVVHIYIHPLNDIFSKFGIEQLLFFAVIFLFALLSPDLDKGDTWISKKVYPLLVILGVAFLLYHNYFNSDPFYLAVGLFSFALLLSFVISKHRGFYHSFFGGAFLGLIVAYIGYELFGLGTAFTTFIIFLFGFYLHVRKDHHKI